MDEAHARDLTEATPNPDGHERRVAIGGAVFGEDEGRGRDARGVGLVLGRDRRDR
jgi:hypothetical protein